jgi:GGDEF domain-containing protein
LIAFEVAGAKPSLINSFAEALRKRIRCYDEIGFIEENRLAVLLPETPLEEAHKLAESLCHTVLPRQRDVRYELYSYPLPCKQDQNNTMEAGCLKPPRDTDRESAQYLLQE